MLNPNISIRKRPGSIIIGRTFDRTNTAVTMNLRMQRKLTIASIRDCLISSINSKKKDTIYIPLFDKHSKK
jgi:hypothetical protein